MPAIDAAWSAYESAKLALANMPFDRAVLSDRSARARRLWAERAAKRTMRARETDLRAARAALTSAGFSEDE